MDWFAKECNSSEYLEYVAKFISSSDLTVLIEVSSQSPWEKLGDLLPEHYIMKEKTNNQEMIAFIYRDPVFKKKSMQLSASNPGFTRNPQIFGCSIGLKQYPKSYPLIFIGVHLKSNTPKISTQELNAILTFQDETIPTDLNRIILGDFNLDHEQLTNALKNSKFTPVIKESTLPNQEMKIKARIKSYDNFLVPEQMISFIEKAEVKKAPPQKVLFQNLNSQLSTMSDHYPVKLTLINLEELHTMGRPNVRWSDMKKQYPVQILSQEEIEKSINELKNKDK